MNATKEKVLYKEVHLTAEYVKLVNGLIDEAMKRVNIRVDARMCLLLEVAPPVLSKLRNGHLALGPSMLLRFHEKCNLSMTEIKKLLTASVYSEIVWNRPDAHVQMKRLWQGQDEVVEQAKRLLINDGFAVLRLGRDSGKKEILAKIMADIGYTYISIYGEADTDALERRFKDTPYLNVHPNVRYNALDDGWRENHLTTLVVIDEPFWNFGSHELFQRMRRINLRVIAVGSRGPEWDNIPFWKTLSNSISRSTWECNANITRSSLQPQYDANPELARRDFEAF